MAGHDDKPVKGTVRVPPLRLVTVSVAFFGPSAAGWNVTIAVVSAPPASVAAAGAATVKSAASVPAIVNGGVSVTSVGLPFAIASGRAVVVPEGTEPKSRDAGATEIPGTAVPFSATDTEPSSELAIVSKAALIPGVCGAKVSGTVAVAPAVSVVVDGAPAVNDVGSLPVMTNGGLSVTVLSSRFLIVIVCDCDCGGMTSPNVTLTGAVVRTVFCGLGRFGATPFRSWKSLTLLLVSCNSTDAPPGFRS